MARVSITVNGKQETRDIKPRTLLVEFLRDHLGLTGTHVGCDTTQCGCCIVLVDGKSVNSCTMLAVQANGSSVTTIEGLADGDKLHPMQAAFRAHHALQCGFCTPGFVMSALELGAAEEKPVGRRYSLLAPRQHVPLHRLPKHHRSRQSRRRRHGAGRMRRADQGIKRNDQPCTISTITSRKRWPRPPRSFARRRDGAFIAGGMSLIAALEATARAAVRPGRSAIDRGAELHPARRRRARHRRHDAACRCRRFRAGARRHPRPRPPGRRDGRPVGAQSRHDRRFDRPWRSGGRLCAGARGARRHDRHRRSQHCRRRRSSPAPSRRRLRKGEIIKAVSFPIADAAAYVKFANTASRYAIVGVFVARRGSAVRVAVTGARSCVFRIKEMEAALEQIIHPRRHQGDCDRPAGTYRRYPRDPGISRPPHRRDGAARRGLRRRQAATKLTRRVEKFTL